MAKTKSNPEEIFFSSIVKKQPEAQTTKNAANESTTNEAIEIEETPKTKRTTAKKETKEKTTQLNVPIPISLKFELERLVNEMKQSDENNRYFIKNFIVEAIEEKIERERTKIGE